MSEIELEPLRSNGRLLRSVVSRKVKLKRAGREWTGLCPFHAEKTPSFKVFDDGHFHCFGCRAHGTVFDFVMRCEGIDFREARDRIVGEAGIFPANETNGKGKHHPAMEEEWHPILPVPAGAPKPPDELLRCDVLHEYRDADDRLLCIVRRYEAKNGKRKQFLPLTYGVLDGKSGWHDKAPTAPKPLYRLNALSHSSSDATVLLCEGEKATDAAQRILPNYVAMTWMGGSSADASADLSPLKVRNVIIWPDADAVGRDAGARLARRLPFARIVDTAGLPEGFDAADLEASGEGDPGAWLDARVPPRSDVLLSKRLAVSTWLSRARPPVDRLLGDFITTTTRAFLVGRTGLGKTMLGLAIAMGVGFRIGFLHWRSDRAARVLYIDGEMPGELLIQRIADAARRVGREDLIDNVMAFSTEDAEAIAEDYPQLGMFEPLNTEPGQEFIKRLCAMLKPDLVIFDNVQCLLAGAQKEEETWIPVLPLVQWLTKQRIGQLWFDHVNAGDRQYGSMTKSWRFDAVGVMTPLPDEDREPYETAFVLSFDPPGKARRRTPANWDEFAPHIIRLRDEVWTSEPVEKRNGKGATRGKVPPSRKVFHDALIDAIAHAGTRPGETTLAAWEAECIRRGLIEQAQPGDTKSGRDRKSAMFRTAKFELLSKHWIGVDADRVADLTQTYR